MRLAAGRATADAFLAADAEIELVVRLVPIVGSDKPLGLLFAFENAANTFAGGCG